MNPDGAVYEGARVALAPAGSSAGSASGALSVPIEVSDSDGRFNFTGVPAGAFQLTISGNGFATQVKSVVLNAGQSYEEQPIVLLVSNAASEVHVTASSSEIAIEQVHEEEKQRIFGIVPNFWVAYAPNAPPLTVKLKFELAWKSSIDPIQWLTSGAIAGLEQVEDTFKGYGQGPQGYGKRFGANFTDDLVSNFVGNAILPSLLKQDPRYFYQGTGTTRSRVLHAIAWSVMCKGDNGHLQLNYSGIAGGLASGGISNLYYPSSDRNGWSITFENAGIGIASSGVQNLLQEFVLKRFTPKLPSYGSAKP
jgi:hypothetical protein